MGVDTFRKINVYVGRDICFSRLLGIYVVMKFAFRYGNIFSKGYFFGNFCIDLERELVNAGLGGYLWIETCVYIEIECV